MRENSPLKGSTKAAVAAPAAQAAVATAPAAAELAVAEVEPAKAAAESASTVILHSHPHYRQVRLLFLIGYTNG